MNILLTCLEDGIVFDDSLKASLENHNEQIKDLYSKVFSSQMPKLLLLFQSSINLLDQLEIDLLPGEEFTFKVDNSRKLVSSNPLKYIYVPSVLKKVFQTKQDKIFIIDPHITKIDIFYSICLFPALTHLKSLTFCNIEIRTDFLLILLFKGIGLLKNLESLNISNITIPKKLIIDLNDPESRITDRADRIENYDHGFPSMKFCIRSLAFSLVQLENLKTLIMVNNNFLRRYLHFLIFLDINNSHIFAWLTKLKCLKLGKIKHNNKDSKNDSKSLYVSSVKIFNRYAKNVNDEDIKEYVSINDRERSLEKPFDFSFLEIVSTNFANLEVIQMRNLQNISPNTFRTILESESLREIDLSFNNIDNNHFDLFDRFNSDTIRPNLTQLQLSGNNLGSADFYKIINSFSKTFTNLEILSLDENRFELFENDFNLKCQSNIRHLYLDRNKISNSVITIISVFMEKLVNLEYLSIKNCELKDEVFLYLVTSGRIPNFIINFRNNYLFINSGNISELKNCSVHIKNFKGVFIHSKLASKNKKLILPELSRTDNEKFKNNYKILEKFLIHHKYKSIIY